MTFQELLNYYQQNSTPQEGYWVGQGGDSGGYYVPGSPGVNSLEFGYNDYSGAYDPATNSFLMASGDARSGGIARSRYYSDGRVEELPFEAIDFNANWKRNTITAVLSALAVAGVGAASSALGSTAGAATEALPYTAADLLPGGTNAAAGATTGAATASGLPVSQGLAGAGLSSVGAAAPGTDYSLEDLMPGGTNAPAGATTGAATASGNPVMGPPAPGTTGVPSMGRPSLPSLPGGPPNVGNLTGNGNLDGFLKLLAGMYGANQQQSFAQQLLQRADQATPNRSFYENALRTSYENPGSYLQSPDVQAATDLTLRKLQTQDAAGGRLGNDIGRQTTLNNYILENLSKYRSGLAGVVNQQANTFTGNNGMFQAGAALDSSSGNNILNGVLEMLGTQNGTNSTGAATTVGTDLFSQLQNWWKNQNGSTSTPSVGGIDITQVN